MTAVTKTHLDALADDARKMIDALRAIVRIGLPDSVESTKWNVPIFAVDGVIALGLASTPKAGYASSCTKVPNNKCRSIRQALVTGRLPPGRPRMVVVNLPLLVLRPKWEPAGFIADLGLRWERPGGAAIQVAQPTGRVIRRHRLRCEPTVGGVRSDGVVVVPPPVDHPPGLPLGS